LDIKWLSKKTDSSMSKPFFRSLLECDNGVFPLIGLNQIQYFFIFFVKFQSKSMIGPHEISSTSSAADSQLHKRGIQTSPDGKNYIQLACDY
jgi:hypothetical protein